MMNFKFKNAVLPCNEKEDFNTTDISVDIICRIFLSEAPSKEHEKIARELDGDNYNPDCFFIESVVGKNEEDGSILTSGWYLGYVTESDNPMNELGYLADDIDGAWEFFKKEIGVEF